MAYTTQGTQSFGFLSAVRQFFSNVGVAMIAAAENSPRMKKISALQSMTDAELAERGIRREDIVRIVYQDVMYI